MPRRLRIKLADARSTLCSAESIASRVSLPRRTITVTSIGYTNRLAIGTAPFMLMC